MKILLAILVLGFSGAAGALDLAGEKSVELRSADGRQGVSLLWSTRQLPYFSLWKNETAIEDGYVTGIEPGTNFPNPRTFEGEQGRVVKLAGGDKYTMTIGIELHDSAESVRQAADQVGLNKT